MNESTHPTERPASQGDIVIRRNGRLNSDAPARAIKQHIGPCLLISRETGAGGSQIARQIAQRLGWKVLDKDIVDILASEYDTPRVVLDTVDEKQVGWIADLLNGWVEGGGFSQLTYVQRLHHLFAMAADQGNVVIVGRGARYILPRQATLSVRVIAPFEFRVEQLILRHGISASKAREFIKDSDHQRIAFIKRYFHQDIADPHSHDLVVNVEQLVPEAAVELIVNSVQSWLIRRGQRIVPVEARAY